MLEQENLALNVMEEAAEIQQAISKCIRFGTENHNPETPNVKNSYLVMKEYYQLCAVMEYAIENGVFEQISETEIELIKQQKIKNVKFFSGYSKIIGRITDK